MTTETKNVEISKPAASCRQNVLTWINLFLFAGLLIVFGLFIWQTQDKAQEASPESGILVSNPGEGPVKSIAYVHSDKLMEGYLLAGKMREELEAEQNRLETDLNRRQRTFQNEVEKFQNDISSGSISMERAQQREQELMRQQQDLMQLNETYHNRLMQKEMEMNNELLNTITEFLERYNAEKNYDYILSYSRGGNVLFANQSLDITLEILSLMNAEHNSKK